MNLSRLILGGAVVASSWAVGSVTVAAEASAHPAGTACRASLSFTADTASVSLSPTGCTHTYELTSWATVAEGNNKGETMLQRVTSPPWIVSLPQGGCSYQVDFRDTTTGRLLAGEQGGVTCQPTTTTVPTTPPTVPISPPTLPVPPTTLPKTTTSLSHSSMPATTPTNTNIATPRPGSHTAISTGTPIPEAPEAPIVRNCGCATG